MTILYLCIAFKPTLSGNKRSLLVYDSQLRLQAIILHVYYIKSSYTCIFYNFIIIFISTIIKIKNICHKFENSTWRTIDLSCKVLSFSFLIHRVRKDFWKTRFVHVAGFIAPNISCVWLILLLYFLSCLSQYSNKFLVCYNTQNMT